MQHYLVDMLNGVIAPLVMAVNRALVLRDVAIGNVFTARQIFFVPEQAVIAVIDLDILPDTLIELGPRYFAPARYG